MIEDGCKICGQESHIGVVGVSNGGVYHHHFCNTCYNRQKFDGEGRVSNVKFIPKYPEFQKVGIRVKELNNGQQLVLKKGIQIVDFWPASEKFLFRTGSGFKGQGKELLFQEMGI